MRAITFAGLLFLFWSGFYTLITILKDEKFVMASFVVTLVVSLVASAIYMAKK